MNLNNPPLAIRIFKRTLGIVPYLVCFVLLALSESFSKFSLANAVLQLVLFLLVVNIPAYRTKRMSYVDIAWPWGLVTIGLVALLLGEGYWLRKVIISSMYLIAGLRMGVFAIKMFFKGHLNQELPRYAYQRKRWKKGGYKNLNSSLQYEISIQGLANMTFLALPAVFQSFNPTPYLTPLEIVGYSLWLLSLLTEHIADLQKVRFAKQAYSAGNRDACCDVGLWKYSRHPNYFAEWMVWNALILSSIPSVFYFLRIENLVIGIGLTLGVLFISRLLYITLVYYTGAVPSEYYSLQKRPSYEAYKQKTNQFFPGRPKS